MAITRISAEQLRRRLPKSALKMKTTDDITPLSSIIGQERALNALELGLDIPASGYNIFVTGISGTGRTTIITDILKKRARHAAVPDDWCYVYNFNEPDAPQAVNLPAGMGRQFQKHMSELIDTLRQELRRVFSDDQFEQQKTSLTSQANQQKHAVMRQLDEDAQKRNIKLQATSMGFQTVAMHNGQPLSHDDYNALPEAQKAEIQKNVQYLENRIAETLRQLAKMDMQLQKALQQLDKDVAAFVVEQYVNDIKEHYASHAHILRYMEDVCVDIVTDIRSFLSELAKENDDSQGPYESPMFGRYDVNVVVDNSRLKGAPVIYETNPTYNTLLGRIEKIPVSGGYVTDFTLIKAGTLLKANGGYLVVDANEIFSHPFVYDGLKRALRNKEARIEDVNELYGTVSVASLKPTPIPLTIKVVLIGWSRIYHRLRMYDDAFGKIFKIRADFDYETESSSRTIQQYAQFIKRVIDEENHPPFDREAVAEIIQYGHRLAGSQKKLSLEFGQIIKIIEQAAYFARKTGEKIVRAEHVDEAIEAFFDRHSLYKEKIRESVKEGTNKIIVSGERVGEINGLSVISVGDLSFGKPNRITAKTYMGSDNLINIERKAGLSGKLHDKGSHILNGYFNSHLGTHMPLSFSASMAFEQSYGRIDGDSASSTELFVLISSLAKAPIKQGIAVTGSINQNGEIQAIGGVNEKIEGFFEVCRIKGFTGEQGVVIPRSNVSNLMLSAGVRKALTDGRFHIWAIDHVEDGLKVLTGEKAGRRKSDGTFTSGSLFDRVQQQMREFSRRTEEYRKKQQNGDKNGKPNNKKEAAAKRPAKKR